MLKTNCFLKVELLRTSLLVLSDMVAQTNTYTSSKTLPVSTDSTKQDEPKF